MFEPFTCTLVDDERKILVLIMQALCHIYSTMTMLFIAAICFLLSIINIKSHTGFKIVSF